MSSSKPTAPMVDDSKMANGTNTDQPVQQSPNMPSNNDPQLDLVPSNFNFNAMSDDQEHGTLPDYSMFDGGSTYDYTSTNNMIGDDMAQCNHFSGDYQEAADAKTPGYPSYNYHSPLAQVGHEFQPSYGAQTPFEPSLSTYEAKTPYVASYSSPRQSLTANSNHISDLNLDVGRNNPQPSGGLFFGAQPLVDFSSGPQEPEFFPLVSPMDTTFPSSAPPTPATQPVSTKKVPTPRKAKTKAMAAIVGEEDSEDEGRSLLSSRAKGKAKAKTTAAEDGQGEHENNAETPATGSANKGKGRKGAAADKTSTNTPTKKPKKKTPRKKVATDTLNSMGHQRLRKATQGGIAQTKPIPHSFDECDEADQTLITMRESGHTWAECKERYAEMEGVVHGASTIPNRYERLKTAFINMRDEDNLRLFDAKKKIEEDFDQRKWALIAAEITNEGGDTYHPQDLRRRFKQLMEKSGFDAESLMARKDNDFKAEEADVEDEDLEEGQYDAYGGGEEQFEYTQMDMDDEDDDGIGGSFAY